jgi:hypothetical protein
MNVSIHNAVVYDLECLPNVWTCCMEPLYGDQVDLYEISEYRDDRHALMQRLNWLQQNHVVMVGYNSESYDYPLLHLFFMNPNVTYEQLHAKSQQIINSGYGDNRWAHTIWPRDRFAPQIDLYKLHHFDNKAKVTSLKALQFAMRSKTVRESRLPFDKPVAQPDVDGDLIPYNKHDVSETKQFALFSLDAINFRIGLVPQFGIECLSWNDTKIGEKMLTSAASGTGGRPCAVSSDWLTSSSHTCSSRTPSFSAFTSLCCNRCCARTNLTMRVAPRSAPRECSPTSQRTWAG